MTKQEEHHSEQSDNRCEQTRFWFHIFRSDLLRIGITTNWIINFKTFNLTDGWADGMAGEDESGGEGRANDEN